MEEFGLDEPPHSPYVRETYDAAIALMLAAEHARSTDGGAIRDSLHAIAGPPGKRYPASAQGVKDALQAIRNGEEIDLDGESSTLDWDERGELLMHTMGVWQFKDGAIEDLYHFDVDISDIECPPPPRAIIEYNPVREDLAGAPRTGYTFAGQSAGRWVAYIREPPAPRERQWRKR